MASRVKDIGQNLERLFSVGTLVGCDETELLWRFACCGDQRAFGALVERHGSMVWSLCRSLLRNPDDADDAFQATFLVLARRAGQIEHPERLGCWLHGVANKVARRALAQRSRRRQIERTAPVGESKSPEIEVAQRELMVLLHTELVKLPAKYRNPLVLCHLEGLTHEAAASQLGWPVGTVRGRLARGREMLRVKLERRGVGLGLILPSSQWFLPRSLILKTTQNVLSGLIEQSAGGTIPAMVLSLTRGVNLMISLSKSMNVVGAVTLGVGLVLMGAGWAGGHGQDPDPKAAPTKVVKSQQLTPEKTTPPVIDNGQVDPSYFRSQIDSLELELVREELEWENAKKAYARSLDSVQKHVRRYKRFNNLEVKRETLRKEIHDPNDPALKRLDDQIRELDELDVKQRTEDASNELAETKQNVESLSRLITQKRRLIVDLERELNANRAIKPIPTGSRTAQVGDILLIEVLIALPGRPIAGEYTVRSDGTFPLGYYGDIEVAGLTRKEIKEALIKKLKRFLTDESLGLVEKDAKGNSIAIAPADSATIFVADEVLPSRPTQKSLEDKLDRILQELDRMKRSSSK